MEFQYFREHVGLLEPHFRQVNLCLMESKTIEQLVDVWGFVLEGLHISK